MQHFEFIKNGLHICSLDNDTAEILMLKNIYTNNSQTEYLNIVPLPLFQNYPTQKIFYRAKCFLSNNHHYWKNTLFADIM